MKPVEEVGRERSTDDPLLWMSRCGTGRIQKDDTSSLVAELTDFEPPSEAVRFTVQFELDANCNR